MRRLTVAIVVLALGSLAPAANAGNPAVARSAAQKVLVAGANAIAPPPHGVGRAAARRRFRPVVEIHRAAEDGATASGSGSVTVTSAAGTCPPP